MEAAPQLCLVDSGALFNRFGRWLAHAAGIPLAGAPIDEIAVGGVRAEGRAARVELALGDWRFDTTVWFCDPWPFGFNLLGQEGFLRYFRVTLSVAEDWLDCEPEPGAVRAG
jgi:hypothetical protein